MIRPNLGYLEPQATSQVLNQHLSLKTSLLVSDLQSMLTKIPYSVTAWSSSVSS